MQDGVKSLQGSLGRRTPSERCVGHSSLLSAENIECKVAESAETTFDLPS